MGFVLHAIAHPLNRNSRARRLATVENERSSGFLRENVKFRNAARRQREGKSCEKPMLSCEKPTELGSVGGVTYRSIGTGVRKALEKGLPVMARGAMIPIVDRPAVELYSLDDVRFDFSPTQLDCVLPSRIGNSSISCCGT